MRKGQDQCKVFLKELLYLYKTKDKIVELVVNSVTDRKEKPAPPEKPTTLEKPVIRPTVTENRMRPTMENHSRDESTSNTIDDISIHTVQLFQYKKVEIEPPAPSTELFKLVTRLGMVDAGGMAAGWEHQLFQPEKVLRTLQKAIFCYSTRPNACFRDLGLLYDSLSDAVRQLLALFEVARASEKHPKIDCKDLLDLYLLVRCGEGSCDRLKTMLEPSQCALMVSDQWRGLGQLSRRNHLYANIVIYVLSVARSQQTVLDHQEEFWSRIAQLSQSQTKS